MRLAIFDMDGTVVDTIYDIHACLNKTLTVYGFSTVELDMTKQYVGSGMRQLIVNAVGEHDLTDMMEIYFRSVYKEHMMNTTDIVSGFNEVLDYLKTNDIKAVILSNKLRQITDDMINQLGITEYFDQWYGGDSFGVKKPSPIGVQGIMSEFKVKPNDSIMIGDSYSDILAGRNAGVRTCFCTYGYGTLKDMEADFTVSSPSEIIDVLEAF